MKLSYTLFVISFILMFAFFAWMVVFSIYEVKFDAIKHLYNGKVNYEISPRALNLLGFRVPFRNVKAQYLVTQLSNCQISQRDQKVICRGTSNNNDFYRADILCSTKFNLFPEMINLSFKK